MAPPLTGPAARATAARAPRTAAAVIDAADADEIGAALRTIVVRSGLATLLGCYPASSARAATLAFDLGLLPSRLADLVRLLVLGDSLPGERATVAVGGDLAESLLRGGILRSVPNGRVATTGLRLVEHWGVLVLCDHRSVHARRYYGDDSAALGRTALALRPRSSLDFCCGVGTQSLLAAQRGAAVVAVDANPSVESLLWLNVALNGLPRSQVRLVIGNAQDVPLADVLPDGGFDTVTCNPPLVPTPEDVPFPFVAAGGPDGLRVTAPVLERMPEVLHRDGTAVLVGMLLGDGEGPHLARLSGIARTHHLDILLIATAAHEITPGAASLTALVDTVCMYRDVDRATVECRISESFAALGATVLYRCHLAVHRTSGPGRVRLTGHWLRGGQDWQL